mmetsp:Transcript_15237/g.34119  ORF Transcript_15237/g.34119 Transcript_15237/m.34119 type:complete len:102 (+) Transcript_15237:4135-4440(+)
MLCKLFYLHNSYTKTIFFFFRSILTASATFRSSPRILSRKGIQFIMGLFACGFSDDDDEDEGLPVVGTGGRLLPDGKCMLIEDDDWGWMGAGDMMTAVRSD